MFAERQSGATNLDGERREHLAAARAPHDAHSPAGQSQHLSHTHASVGSAVRSYGCHTATRPLITPVRYQKSIEHMRWLACMGAHEQQLARGLQ